MSLEENKALVRRFVAAAWTGDTLNLAALEEIVTPDFTDHSAPPDLPSGLPAYRQFVTGWHQAFAGITHTTIHLLAEGDKVVEQWEAEGQHVVDFMGIAATGKVVSVSGISSYQIADGRIVRRWGNSDDIGLLRQLGAIPA